MTYHARVTDAGELVLPADLAIALGLKSGDAIDVERGIDPMALRLVIRPAGAVRDRVDQFIAERADDWDD